MEIFWNNFEFIGLNTFLALIPMIFGYLMIRLHSKLLVLICGFLWLIFLPNTIYILTDISHLFEAWHNVDNFFKLALIFQYSIFSIVGIVTFAISTYFFQRLLEERPIGQKRIKSTTAVAIIILNFIVGFGVVLGGIQRTNSWEVITNPSRVFEDVNTLISSQELLILSFGIGLLANFIYFLMLESVVTWGKKYLKK